MSAILLQRRRPFRPFPLILAGTVTLMFGVVIAAISGYAVDAGYQIPQENLRTDYLIGAVWAIGIGLSIGMWPVVAEDKPNLLLAWVAKCCVTLLVMLPYEQHYDLDCFGYFYAMKWPYYAFDIASPARSRLVVIGIGWYQAHVLDSYHAMKVTFSLIGLIAIYLVYRAAMAVTGHRHSDALLAVALFPSVIFWSSIIGKDPVVFLGVALYVYGVAKWRQTSAPRSLVIIAIGIGLATLMRTWLGLILGVPLVYFGIRGVRGFLPRLASSVAAIALFILVFSGFVSAFAIDSTEDLVAVTDRIAHQFSGDRTGARGSTRDIGRDFTSVPVIIAFAPIGLLSVLFRPLPGEVMNVFGFLSGLENILLLYLTYDAIRALVRHARVRRAFWREPAIVWAILFVITWTTMYGYVSFQNLGASVRFRLPIIAVVVTLLLCVRWLERQVTQGDSHAASGAAAVHPTRANSLPTEAVGA